MTQFLAEEEVIVSQIKSIKKLAEGLTTLESVGSSRDMLELSYKVEELTGLISDTLRRQRVLDAMKHVETLLNNGAGLKRISIDRICFDIRDGEIVHKEHAPFEDDDFPF